MSKVKVNNKFVSKETVKKHYRKKWKKKSFRNLIKKQGVFTKNSFKGKTVVKRKNIKINNWEDLEKQLDNHAVEFIIPTKKTGKRFVDVDIPKNRLNNKSNIKKHIVKNLKNRNVDIDSITSTPSGIHIFTKSSKSKLVNALKSIQHKDKRFKVGRKRSSSKIILDPYENAVAIPGSLSIKGKPYEQV